VFLITVLHFDILNSALVSSVVASLFCRLAKELIVVFTRLVMLSMIALKKVRFDNLDIESVKFMAREIIILRRLDHPNIIKLEGLITSQMSRSLYLVFEYMEHDLTGLASRPGIKFSEPQVPYNGY